MLLAVDVGNTNTKFGLFRTGGETPSALWRVSSSRERTMDEWQALLTALLATASVSLGDVSAVAIASVVPPVTRSLERLFRDRLGVDPTVLTSDQDLGIRVATEVPAETGVDRVLNGLAAFHAFGGPLVVVDGGTATKFDAVSADGTFLGGAIGPGLTLTLDTLSGRAARLYTVELVAPPRAIGTNTVAAIQSGVVLGYLAMCEGMIRRVRDELGDDPTVVATGGSGALIAEHLPIVATHMPTLTLEGILVAFRRLTGST
jgi:type III pantothenate kinase